MIQPLWANDPQGKPLCFNLALVRIFSFPESEVAVLHFGPGDDATITGSGARILQEGLSGQQRIIPVRDGGIN